MLREFAKFWLHHSRDGIWMLPKIVTSFVKHKKTIDGGRKLEHIRELTYFHVFFFVLGFTFLGYIKIISSNLIRSDLSIKKLICIHVRVKFE
jgi:hypothetical protein